MLTADTSTLRLRHLSLAGLVAAAVGLSSAGAPAQEGSEPQAPPEEASLIDPRAEERLRAVSDLLAGADTLTFRAVSFFDEVRESGIQIKRFIVHDVQVDRPGRLAFTSTFDDGTVRQGWYDGETLTVAMPDADRYMRIEAPGDIDALLDLMQQDYDLNLPLADILYSDVYAAQEPYLLSALHLGERILEDQRLDHLSMESTGADWQLWLEQGERPLPRRMVIEFVAAEGQPEYMATFASWTLNEPIDPATFTAEIPEGWEQVEPVR